MRIAVCSDEPYPLHGRIVAELEKRGHQVQRFGSLRTGEEEPWADVAREAARAVASGDCHEGVFCCWSGTGICMAANKVAGVRAALCIDPETARDARIWNHANVLALSNRLMTEARAIEILEAWLATAPDDPRGLASVRILAEMEQDKSSPRG